MFEDITRNKIKSGFIVFCFFSIIALIIYYICMYFDLGIYSIIIAVIFSILSTWSSYYFSDKIVLRLNNARPATKEEYQQLVNILESLIVSSGVQYMPKLYVVEDKQPNAFATGRDPEHSVICVTTGLLQKLDYYELEGVVAHELAHIKNYDIRLSAVVSVMVGFIVMISDLFSRIFYYGGFRSKDDDNKSNGIIMLIGFIFILLSPIFGQLMKLALSRRREFLADATAVEFTRNPDGLISALEKISSDPNQLDYANNATENMYIVNPFRDKSHKEKTSIWSTHPSTADRIEALRNLK